MTMAGETLMNEAGATTEADAAPEQSAEAKRIEQLEKYAKALEAALVG